MHGISKPVLAMAILGYPLVDTIRVFFIRAVHGRSPFSADKNHIHHRLLELGMSHKQTVLTLYLYSIFIVALAFFMPDSKPNLSFVLVGSIAFIVAQSIFFIPIKAEKK